MSADQSADSIPQADSIRLFFCGDVMTGRGIDQVLPHPNDPRLHEPYIGEARSYVELAESVNGAIPRPVEFDYIWGDALAELDRAGVDLRIINLETSVTSSEDYWRDKEIHYRMHPRNINCITAAGIDCCCLANNHVLDWGYDGLAETLRTLDAAGIAHTGAGRDAGEAAVPAVLDVPGKGRVLVFSYGSPTSGVPREWAATAHRPGVNFLEDTSEKTARRIAGEMRGFNRQCDVIVASIHWGGNWGYRTLDEETRFAHQLIEDGIAVVHGHSSHHVKTAEIHSDRLVLYGCGDFLNDYEGISGYEVFRREVLQRFDSSEKSRFCSKTALPKCLTINDRLFCKIAKARGFSAKSKSCNTSVQPGPTPEAEGELRIAEKQKRLNSKKGYQNSHRLFHNLLCSKNLRHFRGSPNWLLLTWPILGGLIPSVSCKRSSEKSYSPNDARNHRPVRVLVPLSEFNQCWYAK